MAYAYYTAIDIQSAAVGANESDFPVALVVTDNRFRTVANGGHIQNTDATGGASGSLEVPADFVVSPNSDGSSPYDFEIVDYDATTGYIELWVEIASLSSSSDTTIYLVYGDSEVTSSQEDVAGTWGNGFEGVWHLGEASGTIYDSTSNGNDSLSGSPANYGASGQVGKGAEFDGSGDFINIGDQSSLELASLTVSVWCKTDNYTRSFNGGVAKGWVFGNGQKYSYQLYWNSSNAVWAASNSSNNAIFAPSINISDNNWHQWVGTYDGSAAAFYKDAGTPETRVASGAIDYTKTNNDFAIGARSNGAYDLDGLIDEVHVSSVARDADWITTAYNNQNDPTPSSTFWGALGAEQGGGGPAPTYEPRMGFVGIDGVGIA